MCEHLVQLIDIYIKTIKTQSYRFSVIIYGQTIDTRHREHIKGISSPGAGVEMQGASHSYLCSYIVLFIVVR